MIGRDAYCGGPYNAKEAQRRDQQKWTPVLRPIARSFDKQAPRLMRHRQS
jgi:hypothetical protein